MGRICKAYFRWFAVLSVAAAFLPVPRFAGDPLDGAIATVAIDDSDISRRFLYYGSRGLSAALVKVSLADHTRVASMVFEPSEGFITKIVIDFASRSLFAGLTNGGVARVELSNFTRSATVSVADGSVDPAVVDLVGVYTTVAIAPAGRHLFSATQGSRRAVVRRIVAAGPRLTIASTLLLEQGEASIATMLFLPDAAADALSPAGRLYASVINVGRVGLLLEMIVDANGTISRGRSVDNQPGESWGTDMALDTRTGSIIVPIRNDPGRITRLRLSDMVRVSTVTLPAGVEFAYAAVLDTVQRRIFIFCLTTPLAVATLSADDLSLLNVMSIATAREALEFALSAVLDPTTGLIYAGLGTLPGSLLVVDASRGAAAGGGTPVGGQLMVAGAVRQQNVFAGRTQRVLLLERSKPVPAGYAPAYAAPTVFSSSSRQGLWRLRAEDLSISHYLIAPLVRISDARIVLNSDPTESPVGALINDPGDSRLYMGILSSPAQVLKVAVASGLLLEGALDLPANMASATALVLAPGRNSLLVGIGGAVGSTGASLAEIGLPAFTAATPVPLGYPNFGIATGGTFCLAIAGSNGSSCTNYGFFLSTPSPVDSRVLLFRVDLLTLIQISTGFYITGAWPLGMLQPSALLEGPPGTAWVVMSVPPPATGQLLSSQSSVMVLVSLEMPLQAVPGMRPVNMTSPALAWGMPLGPVVGGSFSPSRNATLVVTGGPSSAVYSISRSGIVTAAAALPAPAFSAAWDEAAGPGGAFFLASATAESIADTALAATSASAANATSGHGAVVRVPLLAGSVAQPTAASASGNSSGSSSSIGASYAAAAQRTLDVPVSATPPGVAFPFEGHLYIVGGRLRTAVQRVRMADFSLAGSAALPFEDTAGTGILLTPRRTAVLTGHVTGTSVEIELPSLAVRAFGSVPMYVRTAAALEADGLVVMGSTGGFVCLVNVSSPSGVNAQFTTYILPPPNVFQVAGANFWTASVAHIASRRIYMVSLAGAILRIDPTRFNASVTSPANVAYVTAMRAANSIVVDGAGRFAFVGTRTEPARIVQVSITASGALAASTVVLNMVSGLDNFVVSTLLSLPFFGEFAIFCTGSETSPAIVQAMALPSMTLLQPIPLRGNVASTAVAITSTGQSQLFITNYVYPHRVFRLDAGALITAVLSGAAPPSTASLLLSPGQGEGMFAGALAALVPPASLGSGSSSGSGESSNASLTGAAAANGAIGILIAGAGTASAPATAGAISLSLPSLQPLARLGSMPSGEDYFGAAAAYVVAQGAGGGGGPATGADARATSLQGALAGERLLGWAFLCTDRRLTGGINASAESVVKVAVTRSGALARESAVQLPRVLQSIVFAVLVQEAASPAAPALYVGGALNPGALARVNTSSMTVTHSVALPSSATGVSPGTASSVVSVLGAGAVDAQRGLLYVAAIGAAPAPARLLRFTLPDLLLSGPPLLLASSVGGGWATGDVPRSLAFDSSSAPAGQLLVGAAAWNGYLTILAASGDTSAAAAADPIATYVDTVPLSGAATTATGSTVRSIAIDAAAGFAFAALDGDPPSLAQLRLDSRLAQTPGVGTGASRITSVVTATPGTPRIGITLAAPPAGAPAGSPSLVIAGSESIPGIVLTYEATPPAPAVTSIDAGMLPPPASLCEAVRARGWNSGACVYAASEVSTSPIGSSSSSGSSGGNWTIRGSIFGHFMPPSPQMLSFRAAPVVRLVRQMRLLRSGDLVDDDAGIGIMIGEPLAPCIDFGCSDGRTCWCSLPSIPAAPVPRVVSASNGSAVQLSVTVLSVGMSRDDISDDAAAMGAAPPLLVTVVSGAPAILSIEPAVIASHTASLRVTMALGPRGFDPAKGDAIELSGEESLAAAVAAGLVAPRQFNLSLTCAVQPGSLSSGASSGNAAGQVVTCIPPPLCREYLAVRFDAVLRRGGGSVGLGLGVGVGEAFRLQAAVQYAWPVLAAVSPVDGLPADARPPQTLTFIAPAVVTDAASSLASPLPPLTVWVGGTPCAACVPVDMRPSAGRFACRAPAGIGARVPVTIDVGFDAVAAAASNATAAAACTAPGRCGIFSIYSVEALAAADGSAPAGAGPGALASVYDGLFSVLPLPPRQGFLTVLSYALPTVTSAAPLLVPAVTTIMPQQTTIVLKIAGAHLPPAPAMLITLGDSAPGSNTSCIADISANATVASCSFAVADLVSAATSMGTNSAAPLAGRAVLPLWVTYASPAWPASTALPSTSLGLSLTLVGLPVVRAVAPQVGGAGQLLTISGASFRDGNGNASNSSSPSVTVTVGSAPCTNVTLIDDATLTCIAPTFEGAAAGIFAGTTILPVNVITALGGALTAVSSGVAGRGQPPLPAALPVFRYMGQLRISWALNRSVSADGMSSMSGDVTVSGLAPIGPVPAALLERGNFTSCALVPAPALGTGASSAAASASPVWTVEGVSRIDFSALPQRDARVAFPDALLVAAPAFAPFTANLTVACTDESVVPAATVRTEPLPWPVAAPRVRWSDSTSSFLAGRQLFLPSDSDTPPISLTVDVAQPVAADGSPGAGTGTVSRMLASPRVFAALLRYLTCTASLMLTHAQSGPTAAPSAASPLTPPRLLAVQDGVVNASADTAAAAGFFGVTFPALSLAAVPVGSIVNVTARCTWAPAAAAAGSSTSSSSSSISVPPAYETLPALRLPVIGATVEWVRMPPQLSRSNSYMEPSPSIRLSLFDPATAAAVPAPSAGALLPSSARYKCEMDARKDDSGSAGVNTNSSNDGGAADYLSLRQSLESSPAEALTFAAFGVSARIQSRLTIVATCVLGSQTLPEATAVTRIAGCRPGQAPSGSSGWLCIDCPAEAFSRGGDDPCELCPRAGAACDGGTLRPLQGYFRPPTQAALPISATTELHQCPNPEACLVAVNSSATDAASEVTYSCDTTQGYSGVLCGQCLPGWSPFGIGVCAHCWPMAANVTVLAILALLIVAAIAWLALYARPGSRSASAISLRQAITFLQTVSVITAFGAQAQLRALLGWTDVANGSVLSIGPIGCALPASLPTRFYALLATPAIVGAAIAAIAGMHAACGRRRASKDKAHIVASRAPAVVAGGDAEVDADVEAAVENPRRRPDAAISAHAKAATLAPNAMSQGMPSLPATSSGSGLGSGSSPAEVSDGSKSGGRWRKLLRSAASNVTAAERHGASRKHAPVPLSLRLGSAMLTIASLLAMPIVSTALRLLDCTQPVAGVSYVRTDLSVACGSQAHSAARAVAWAALAAVGLGFPAAIILALARVPRQRPLRSIASAGSLSGSVAFHSDVSSHGGNLKRGSADASLAAGGGDTPAAVPGDPPLVLRPLYDGYSRSRGVLWWEGVIMLRKSILALVATLLGGTIRGLALVALLLAIAHALQGWIHPYDEPRFNAAESASSAATLAIALLALMYNSGAAAGIVTTGSGAAASVSPSTAGVIDASAAAAVTATIAIVLAPTLAFLLVQLLRSASATGGIIDRARRFVIRTARRCGCGCLCPGATANLATHRRGQDGADKATYFSRAGSAVAAAAIGPGQTQVSASATASSPSREELARRARLSLLASQSGFELTTMSMGASSTARRSIVGGGARADGASSRRRTSVSARAQSQAQTQSLPTADSASADLDTQLDRHGMTARAARLSTAAGMRAAAHSGPSPAHASGAQLRQLNSRRATGGAIIGDISLAKSTHFPADGVSSSPHRLIGIVDAHADAQAGSDSALDSAWVDNPIASGSSPSPGPGPSLSSSAAAQTRRRSGFGAAGDDYEMSPVARNRHSGFAASFAVVPLRARTVAAAAVAPPEPRRD